MVIVYRGTCDASAAVLIGPTAQFVSASDEDYVLRVYDTHEPGLPVASLDLTTFLEPANPGKEPDIEGAAVVDDRVYWICSHGRDRDGAPQESRQRFFATALTVSNGEVLVSPLGRPYKTLLRDLVADADLRGLGLEAAARLPPESPGGLNIEGLAPTPRGHLLIGFRNPVPRGQALVVRLHNPADLVTDSPAPAVLSVAGRLDLGGRGIRAMEFVPSSRTYLLVAGAVDDARDAALYRWSGRITDPAREVVVDALRDINPEELIVTGVSGSRHTLQVFSDDSDTLIGGKKCKKVKDEILRSFRAQDLTLDL